jgi:hypothetical protein
VIFFGTAIVASAARLTVSALFSAAVPRSFSCGCPVSWAAECRISQDQSGINVLLLTPGWLLRCMPESFKLRKERAKLSKEGSLGRSLLAFVLGPIWLPFALAGYAIYDTPPDLGAQIIVTIIFVYASLFAFGLPVFLILWKRNLLRPASAVLIGAVAGPLPPIVLLMSMWASGFFNSDHYP